MFRQNSRNITIVLTFLKIVKIKPSIITPPIKGKFIKLPVRTYWRFSETFKMI